MDFELAGSIFLGQKRFDFMVRALVLGRRADQFLLIETARLRGTL